jgi:hypothetical protein
VPEEIRRPRQSLLQKRKNRSFPGSISRSAISVCRCPRIWNTSALSSQGTDSSGVDSAIGSVAYMQSHQRCSPRFGPANYPSIISMGQCLHCELFTEKLSTGGPPL